MSTAFPKYKIILSVRSPIFAPLYLAKVRGNAFRNIEFTYAFELPTYGVNTGGTTDKPDVLAEYVLSKSVETQQYIAGVADPFRCLMQSDGALYKPKVLGSLIQHQTFWLASDDPELKVVGALEAAQRCDYIISQPRYTSGYAVLTDFVGFNNHEVEVTLGQDFDKIDGCRPRIFHNVLPGFEREHYLNIVKKSCSKGTYAYLTTNPADHDGPIAQFAHLPPHIINGKKYKNTLMSALFCGNGWYCKYPTLFDDIRGDIVKAIEATICDPVRVAVELKEYSRLSGDRFMKFSTENIPHTRLVNILDDLIRDKVYSPDLMISEEQIRNGADIRRRFKSMATDKDRPGTPASRYGTGSSEEVKCFIEHYFEKSIIGNSPYNQSQGGATETGDKERTENMEQFVRQSIKNYRQTVDQYYQGAANRNPTVNLRRYGNLIWLLLAFVLAMPYPAVLCGGWKPIWIFGTSGFENYFWTLTVLSATLWVPAYMSYMFKYTNGLRASLLYDFIVLLTLSLNVGTATWTILKWLDPDLPLPLSPSDKLSVQLFYCSNSVLIFGAFVLTTRDRLAKLWEKVVLQWKETCILNSRVNQSTIPKPLTCGKNSTCIKCFVKNRIKS